MDIASIAGLIAGLTTIVVVLIMDGGTPAELFAHPSAIILIIGGSLSATIITSPMSMVMKLPQYIMQVFKSTNFNPRETIDLLSKLADKARRDGLLALEDDS